MERAINANYRLGTAANAKALAQYATRNAANDGMRAEALLQLGLWGKTPQRDRIVGIYRPLAARDGKPAADALTAVLPKVLGQGPEAVQLAALEAIGNLQLREAAPALIATVANEKAPEAVRVGALKALDAFGGDDVMRGIEAAEKSSSAALRLAALQIVAQRAPERALPIVRRLATEGSEAEQQAAFLAMGQLKSRRDAEAAGGRARSARGRQGAAGRAARADRSRRKRAMRPAVKARWAKQQAAWAASGNALAPYSFALAGGNPRRGGREFFREPGAALRALPQGERRRWRGRPGSLAHRQAEEARSTCSSPSSSRARTSPRASTSVTLHAQERRQPRPARVASESPTQIVLKRADNTTVEHRSEAGARSA